MEIDSRDTITAIATPPGSGGVAIIRISGPDAIAIAGSLWKGRQLASLPPRYSTLGKITGTDGDVIDEALATIFKGPASFTGEDVVEIALHGSTYIQQAAIEALISAGARPAQPGEFTQRAFLNNRIDLTQAEAIADLIASTTKAAHKMALAQASGTLSTRLSTLRDHLIDLGAMLELELDFAEEDVEFADRSQLLTLFDTLTADITRLTKTYKAGNAFKHGITVAIVGEPNAGKSTLLNTLAEDDKAIVSPIAGTTRDCIEATTTIDGLMFRLIDTAGYREKTDDPIEALGIKKALETAARASIILHLTPACQNRQTPDKFAQTENATTIEVTTKIDLCDNDLPHHSKSIRVSALTGEGIGTLKNTLSQTAHDIFGTDSSDILLTNSRHLHCLENALSCTTRAKESLLSGMPEDLIAQDIRQAAAHLGEITGTVTSDTLLHTIFSRFCIGK